MFGDQHEALNSDVLEMSTRLHENDTPTNRRALIHATSAYIEGCAYGLRQTAIERDNENRILSEGDRQILSETSYRLNRTGSVQDVPSFQRFERMLLFTFRSFAAVHGAPDYKIDTTDVKWRSVKTFIKLRNRITHPKSASDLECSDADIDATLVAFEWFHDKIIEIGKLIGLIPERGA